MHDLTCPECGLPMTLRQSKYGPFYGCTGYPGCTCKHGAHANGSPKGIPGDAATRAARIRAHEAFDQLWKGASRRARRHERGQAYLILQEIMGMTADEAHIGRFTIEECERIIAGLEAKSA